MPVPAPCLTLPSREQSLGRAAASLRTAHALPLRRLLRRARQVVRLVVYIEGEDEENIEPNLVFQVYCEYGETQGPLASPPARGRSRSLSACPKCPRLAVIVGGRVRQGGRRGFSDVEGPARSPSRNRDPMDALRGSRGVLWSAQGMETSAPRHRVTFRGESDRRLPRSELSAWLELGAKPGAKPCRHAPGDALRNPTSGCYCHTRTLGLAKRRGGGGAALVDVGTPVVEPVTDRSDVLSSERHRSRIGLVPLLCVDLRRPRDVRERRRGRRIGPGRAASSVI